MSSMYFIAALLIVCIVFFFVLAEIKRNYDMTIDLLQDQLERERELHVGTIERAAEEQEKLLDRLQSDNFAQFKTFSGDGVPPKSSKPSNFLKASIEAAASKEETNNSTF